MGKLSKQSCIYPQVADLFGQEMEVVGQLISVFQIDNVVVMSFGILLLTVVEKFPHYLKVTKVNTW